MFWNTWYVGWGWILWLAVIVLFFGIAASWSYSYDTRRRYPSDRQPSDALDILNERYARGELNREEYTRMRAEISEPRQSRDATRPEERRSA